MNSGLKLKTDAYRSVLAIGDFKLLPRTFFRFTQIYILLLSYILDKFSMVLGIWEV